MTTAAWERDVHDTFTVTAQNGEVHIALHEPDARIDMTCGPHVARWIARQLLDAANRADTQKGEATR